MIKFYDTIREVKDKLQRFDNKIFAEWRQLIVIAWQIHTCGGGMNIE